MILIAGATGMLGSEICRRTLARGVAVRGIVRATSDPARVRELQELGAETAVADVKDPGTLETACAGATTVVSGVTAIFPTQPGDSIETVDRDGNIALIDAAVRAGARRFLFISYSDGIDGPSPLTEAKRAVERHLAESGLTYTILKPTYFMETWLGPAVGFDLASGRVRVFGAGDRKLSWIALGDVAEFAAACLAEKPPGNAEIALGGPDEVSPLEVVFMAEAIGGRSIAVEHVPLEELEHQRAGSGGLTERSVADLMLNLADGDVIAMERTLATFPVGLTSVRDYLGAALTR